MNPEIKEILSSLIRGESNFISNSANFTALMYSNMRDVNWVGFYLINNGDLVLGPFQGKAACMKIPSGKGVCGAAVKNRRTIVVGDVHEFPGHIPCDPTSASEMVIPLIHQDKIYGVLDIDSPSRNRFRNGDIDQMTEMVEYLMNASDMSALEKYYKV